MPEDVEARLAAVLAAFGALGFFAASLLTVFWLLVVITTGAAAVILAAVLQGNSILHSLGFGAAAFAVAQVGFGLGLAWVATLHKNSIPD